MPNKENINRLIETLKSVQDHNFSMSTFGDAEHCGTPACIAGWTNRILYEDRGDEHLRDEIQLGFDAPAERFLGITSSEASALFYMLNTDRSMETVTREGAIAVLEHFRDTGQVNWDLAPELTSY